MTEIPEKLHVVYEKGVQVGAFVKLDSAETIVKKRVKVGKPQSEIWLFEKVGEVVQPDHGKGTVS